MDIIEDTSVIKILKDSECTSLILGFFDGIHRGHRCVINSAVEFAKKNGTKTVLLTFKDSPAAYFGRNIEYIYPREYSFELIEKLGVDYLIASDFSSLAEINAEEYLKNIIDRFHPKSISTGFNYTFGKNKIGSPVLLEKKQDEYNYKYLQSTPQKDGEKIISSTYIKELITNGDMVKANELLETPFKIKSLVIEGEKLGRQIGFPTANMKYPNGIVRIPYGVYKVNALNKPAILNWGIKPTVNGLDEGLEVHIPNFDGNLYYKDLEIEILQRIRSEKKFAGIDELKSQIKKDIEECLK